MLSLSLALQAVALLGCCVAGWGFSLSVLQYYDIPVAKILNISSSKRPKYLSYNASVIFASLSLFLYILISQFCISTPLPFENSKLNELLMFSLLLVILIIPSRIFYAQLRFSLLRHVKFFSYSFIGFSDSLFLPYYFTVSFAFCFFCSLFFKSTCTLHNISSLFRALNPFSFAKTQLADVIFTDVLTSCSRIFADLAFVFCGISSYVFQARSQVYNHELTAILDLNHKDTSFLGQSLCRSPLLNPIVTSIPYLLRFRQCIYDYLLSSSTLDKNRHFANAVKYFSSLPVIFLSAFQKEYAISKSLSPDSPQTADWFFYFLFVTWLSCAIFNSIFSYYWDIAFDWGLGNLESLSMPNFVYTLLSSDNDNDDDHHIYDNHNRQDRLDQTTKLPQNYHELQAISGNNSLPNQPGYSGPLLLREKLAFGSPVIYYAAMILDFALRASWTVKLSSHIQLDNIPYMGFLLGFLEIFRRFVWVLFRVEKEIAT